MKANVDQQEKENMIKACEYDIDLMKNERENFDRQYLGGDAAIDSTAYLQARLNEMERLKKIF
ncbi:MAG: hypothetical protein IT286_01925 [Proteobacteria bacterium]|nr:hypothetical protein [Pseudomonadota bacterium]